MSGVRVPLCPPSLFLKFTKAAKRHRLCSRASGPGPACRKMFERKGSRQYPHAICCRYATIASAPSLLTRLFRECSVRNHDIVSIAVKDRMRRVIAAKTALPCDFEALAYGKELARIGT